MDVRIISGSGAEIIEIRAGIERVGHAMDLVGLSYDHGAARILLHDEALPPAFFDLSTGFAGEFVQKLVNHGLVVAGVFVAADGYSLPMRAYLVEARGGWQFRAFESRDEALAWLAASDLAPHPR